MGAWQLVLKTNEKLTSKSSKILCKVYPPMIRNIVYKLVCNQEYSLKAPLVFMSIS